MKPFGWHLGVWWSTDLREEQAATPGDQIDITGGYIWKRDGHELTADVIYKDMIPLSKSDGDVLVTRLKFSHQFDLGEAGKLTPYVTAECWMALPDFTRRPIATIGAQHELPLGGGLSAKAGGRLLYDYGTPLADRGFLATGQGGLGYKVNDWLSLDAAVARIEPLGLSDRKSHTVLMFTVTIKL
jgi:hypothetical protein